MSDIIDLSTTQEQETPKVDVAKRVAELDAMLEAEEQRDYVLVESDDPLKKNVRRKNVQTKIIPKDGEIAHYHQMENEFEIWDQACPFTRYLVRTPGGVKINEQLFHGPVVVPVCVANDLAWMDSEYTINELAIHTNRGRTIPVGEVVG
jgi:hypothetical protein